MLNKVLRALPILLIISLLILTTSGRGCPKRSRNKIGSSNEWAGIAAPSSLTATAFSYSEIRLSWQDNSNNEDGFELQRRVGLSGSWVFLSSVNADIASYADTNVFRSITYYYRVRAFNSIGDYSGFSNEAAMTVPTISVSRVAAGGYHSLAILDSGVLLGWGLNDSFQLGLNDTINRNVPTQIGIETDWSTLAGGGFHSVAIKNNYTLWSWGLNGAGQLGLGDSTFDGEIPYQVGTDSDWSKISAGFAHTVALKTNRTIWSFGSSWYGQLGLNDSNNRISPSQIGTDSDWSLISAGAVHTLAVKSNGTVWAWGDNTNGQLGLGGAEIGNLKLSPVQISPDSDWVFISVNGGVNDAVEAFSMARKSDGSVWCWGLNSDGQLGLGDTVDRSDPARIEEMGGWGDLSAGGYHAVGVNGDTIWSWGRNDYGQLGLGNSGASQLIPERITSETGWVAGFAGYFHSLILKTDGTLWSFGANPNGELGLGDTQNRNIPTLIDFGLPNIPVELGAVLVSSLRIDLSWTDSSNNEDGFEIERKNGLGSVWVQIATVPVNVSSYSDITGTGFSSGVYYYYRVRAYNDYGRSPYSNEAWMSTNGFWFSSFDVGEYHTIALKTDGSIWSWGLNDNGQLGLGDVLNRKTPGRIGSGSDWSDIGAGFNHAIAKKNDKTLWAWGRNNFGQLGIGILGSFENTPAQVGTESDWSRADGGENHTLALKTNGTVWSWGLNNYGQLGLGIGITNRTTPSQVGTSSDWSTISVTFNHNLCIKANGTLWAWGYNASAQLGLGVGDYTNRYTPCQVGSASDWSAAAGGLYHTIALKSTGTIWAWGYNVFGELGLGDSLNRQTPVRVGSDTDWVTIWGGHRHTVARKINNTFWTWGTNYSGQLGLGDYESRFTPSQLGLDSDWTRMAISAWHTILNKSNGTLWSRGRNSYGQLGLGNVIDRNTPTLIGE